MTKKIMAFLTSVLCVASMAAMPAFAEEYTGSTISAGENDALVIEKNYGITAMYVETNGTELNADAFSSMLTTDRADFQLSVRTWSEFAAEEDFFNSYAGINFAPANDGYYVSVQNLTDEEIAVLGRKMMLKCDFIKDIQLLTKKTVTDNADYGNFRFVADFVSDDIDPSALEIPELVDFDFSNSLSWYRLRYPEYDYEKYIDGRDYLASEEMPDFHKQFYAQFENANCYSGYMWMQEYADAIVEKYPNVFADLTPYISGGNANNTKTYISGSIPWNEFAGDSNTDGAVDASDAADVLTIAAQNGTGAGIKATSANDVNADGNVDASDAAAVLCYAAAQGTGAEVSWVDILRK